MAISHDFDTLGNLSITIEENCKQGVSTQYYPFKVTYYARKKGNAGDMEIKPYKRYFGTPQNNPFTREELATVLKTSVFTNLLNEYKTFIFNEINVTLSSIQIQ